MNTSERRLPVGQLLGLMLRRFRADLLACGKEAGYANLRQSHLQVFGNIDWSGTRLTDLAARAAMTRPSMLELVDELVKAGYLERRPDERDGRAKLICLTRDGRRVVVQALRAVRQIESTYADEVGAARFEEACLTLHELLRQGSLASTQERSKEPALSARRRGG
ncbi:MAG TPA: MarR family transcriptional regulator [Candidatus Limnocylindrales bacterium]|jgi:DNA-binding MarR family transcriptional regulator